jgi:ankyrin repeat protein
LHNEVHLSISTQTVDDDFFDERCTSLCKLMEAPLGIGMDPIICDVNVSDSYGRTALHYAAEQGHADIIDVLLVAGSFVNAMTFGNEKVFQNIFEIDCLVSLNVLNLLGDFDSRANVQESYDCRAG